MQTQKLCISTWIFILLELFLTVNGSSNTNLIGDTNEDLLLNEYEDANNLQQQQQQQAALNYYVQNRQIRRPFNSWAGKRSGEMDEASNGQLNSFLHELRDFIMMTGNHPIYAYQQGKRANPRPFHSWAGKKKRAPFNSWAGKKKRAPFNSWAGRKRSVEFPEEGVNDVEEDDDYKLRTKRSSSEYSEEEDGKDAASRRRRFRNPRQVQVPFSAWGGKRGIMDEESRRRFTRNVDLTNLKVMRPARAAFSAWGGR